MKYIVWGCGKYGMWVQKKIEECTEAKSVVAFADNNLSKVGHSIEGIPVISIWKLLKDYNSCRVLIPGSYGEASIREISMQLLERMDKNQIYIVPFNVLKSEKVHFLEDLLCPLENWTQIDNLGIKLANHCNLNCIRCNNFSNISEENYYMIDELNNDLKQLKSLISNICNIKLIGGEPLLNSNLTDCIKCVKKYYPHSKVIIVTNGLLIKNLTKEQISCIRDNNVKIAMTLYPILKTKIDEIAIFLKNNEIEFSVYRSGDYFIPILNEEGKYHADDIKLQNNKNKCVSFFKGDICRCTAGLNITAYNKKYNKSYPTDGIYNIYEDGMNGEKLMKALDEPFELCRYCNGCFNINEKQFGKIWSLGKAHADDWLEE